MFNIKKNIGLFLLLVSFLTPAFLTNTVAAQICDRTTPFPALLSAALSDQACELITVADLNSITAAQDWSSQNIANISATDLAGLNKVENINFANNNITTLVTGTFAEVRAKTLDFSNNNISVIAQDALDFFGDDEITLDWNFSNNSISSNTFESGFLLDHVHHNYVFNQYNFSYNNITTVKKSYFNNINARMMDLSYNQIINFPSDAFGSLQTVSEGTAIYLYLNNNNITALQANSFNTDRWTSINLANNQISSLAPNTFSNVGDLTTLDLSHNQIVDFNASSVGKTSGFPLTFYLDGNPLILKPSNFSGRRIRHLYLRELPTSTIPSNTFAGISFLDNIYMSNGNISELQTDAFTNAAGLDNLYLDNNSLTNIPGDAFGSGSSLNNLYLQDNQIASIGSSAFAQLTELNQLDLSNNSLTSLSSASFDGLRATNIDLSDNSIATLPLDLLATHTRPESITNFDLTGNAAANNQWEITTAQWQQNIDGSFQLHIGHAISTAISVTISSVNGTLSHSTLTIAAGSTSSQAVTWTQTVAGSVAEIQATEDQINDTVLGGFITLPDFIFMGVCDRTTPFPDLLTAAVGDTNCIMVMADDLDGLTATQDWSSQNISTINAEDLAGLFNIKNINFATNNITTLVNGTFEEVTAHTLDFSNNNISVIEQDALTYFGAAPFKLDWNFSNNAITSNTLASGFLVGKSREFEIAISEFNLSYNNITTIQKAYFDGINVDVLDLSHNQIVNFPANTFDTIYHTADGTDVTLHLNHNNITALQANSFTEAAWENIYLANNQISSLGTNTFNTVGDLRTLDLSNNQIVDFNASSVEQGGGFVVLNHLFFDNNPLILKTSNFSGLSVRNLYLRELPTSTIPSNTFASINLLDTIYMSNGNISELQTDAFTNAAGLDRLYLDNNSLTNIPSDAFGSGSSLNNLYLQDNQIASIGSSAFSQLTELNQLDLSNNSLTSLSSASFDGLAATNIVLSDNSITTLPLDLLATHTRPESITNFDLTGNAAANNPWEITTAQWQQNIDGSFQLHLGHAIPTAISVTISSVNGTLSHSTLTIAAGSTSSQAVTWTQTVAGSVAEIQATEDQINDTVLGGFITLPDLIFMGVCDRTTPFPDLLTAAVGDTNCVTVMANDLDGLTAAQDWSSQNISTISATDLAGLFNVDTFNFASNNLTKLVDGTFKDTKGENLDFSNNNISIIEKDALDQTVGYRFDAVWDFSNNAITSDTLATGFMVGHAYEEDLEYHNYNFSYNNITTIQKAYFDGINVDVLDLSHNQIVNFPANTFDTIFYTEDGANVDLYLNHNNITALATNSFVYKAWEGIYFANNQISALGTNTFNSVDDLAILDLSYNQIVDFNSSAVTKSTKSVAMNLFLDGNPLILKPSNFSGLKVSNLYLRELPTSTIPSNTFASIILLDTIYLSNGNISELQTDAFTNAAGLDNLYLDNNSLTNIPSDAFGSGSSLKNLYLQDNQIASIGTSAFAQLGSLATLDLSDNDLTTLQSGDFLGMPATNIDVSDNQIASLPINLFNQHNDPSTITNFNISGNSLTNNTWEITQVYWIEDLDGNYTLQLGHNLPVDINLNLTSVTGTLSPSTISIAAGSTSSQTVTWTPTNAGDPANFTVDIDQVNVTQLSGYINIPSYAFNGVCDRTTPIPALLSAALSDQACASITVADLNSITAAQDWSNQSISAISSADLDGLTQVQNINFANNNITTLVDGTFLQTAVKNHNFSNNNISIIERDALDHSALYHFDAVWNFSNNAITSDTLASGFMLGHAHPTELEINNYNFSYNNITTIQKAYFDGINVDALDLSHNQIVNFPANTFDTLYPKDDGPDVTLRLNHNNITALATNSFGGEAWEDIYLANNQISSLGTNAFDTVGDLRTLDLSYNQIVDFNASSVNQGSGNVLLTSLLLDANPLVLKPSNFANIEVLNLYLRELPTSTIPSNTFASISGLDTLRMGNGNISILEENAFANTGSLTRVDLANNKLESIPSGLFGSGSNINRLYLQDNQIASIGSSAFAQLTALNELDLSGNNLTSLSSASFDGLRATTIDLSDNDLALIPLNLLLYHTRPESITSFDLTGNAAADTLWEITTAQWQENNDGSFTLQLGHAIPSAISVALSSSTGSLSHSTLTIAAGSTNSQAVTWTQTVAGSSARIQPDVDQVNVTVLGGFVALPTYDANGICGRSSVIQAALLNSLNIQDCLLVTAADLATLSGELAYNDLNINALSEIDLDGLVNIVDFDLSDNQITNLSTATFVGATMQQIDLSYNLIDAIADSSIQTATNLTRLNLGYNQIVDFNVTAIDQNPSQLNVQLDLVLDGNPLALKANNFAGLDLNYVYLQSANLTTIPADVFAGATNINRLYFVGSNITALETGSFSSAPGLDYLYLNNNQITDIAVDAFGAISTLTRIYLGDNNLTALPENTFSNLTQLQLLSLDNNQLTAVPVNILGNNASLTMFRLQSNNITNLSAVSFSAYTSLSELNLDDNQITELSADNFAGLTATKIYLADNQITSLPLNMLLQHNNPASITSFDISGNNLTDNSWEITNVSWIEAGNQSYALTLGHALPEDLTIKIVSSTGILNSSSVTITAGDTNSSVIQWTPFTAADEVHLLPASANVSVASLAGHITVPAFGVASNLDANVCARTPAVIALLLNATGQAQCEDITISQLVSVTDNLNWGSLLNVPQLSAIDLDYLWGIEHFDLSNNNITSLINNTFLDTSADSLSVADNNISVIEVNALLTVNSPNNNVAYDLSNNAITSATLATEFLAPLKSSTYPNKSFDLSSNAITTLAKSYFDVYAMNLNLSNNQIASFPADTFDNMMLTGNDMALDLSDNLLTTLPTNVIASGAGLTQLLLHNNQIASIDNGAFGQLTDLAVLDLSNNNLNNFSADAVAGLTATDIDLSDNALTSLPLNLFIDHADPVSITNFAIAGNSITNNSWEITSAVWEEDIDGTFALLLGHSLPVDVELTLTSDTGTVSPNSITISAGDTDSADVQWTPSQAGSAFDLQPSLAQVTVPNLSGYITTDTFQIAGVCDRTAPLPTVLSTILNVSDCSTVTITQMLQTVGLLDLSNREITQLTSADFAYFDNIADLDLSSNNLTTLPNNIMFEMDPTSLSVAGNNISVIEVNALRSSSSPANNLDYNLSNNAITSTTLSNGFLNSLKDGSFPNKKFDLSFNNITTINSSHLNLHAKVLNLSHNQISDLDAQSFINVRRADQFMTLDISYNNLTALVAQTIFGETYETVDFSHNQISSLETQAIIYGERVKQLDLGYNQIVDFNASSFHQVANKYGIVANLILDGNPLTLKTKNFEGLSIDDLDLNNITATDIPAFAFEGIDNLDTIRLSNSDLTQFDADAFNNATGLAKLYLDNNFLTSVPVNAFGDDTSLTELYLNDNQIATLADGFAAQLNDLEVLDLSGNNLATLQAAQLQGMTATSINLSNNLLTELPLNLLSQHNNLTSITSFDISGNLLSGNTWEITTAQWQANLDGSFTLLFGHGLPSDVTLNLESTTGTISPATITITAGSASSENVVWTTSAPSNALQIQASVSQLDYPQLSGYITIPSYQSNGICDRTAQLQSVLLSALNTQSCPTVTIVDLVGLTGIINVSNQNMAQLTAIDLDSLVNVPEFDFSTNAIATLVSDVLLTTDATSYSFANNAIDFIALNALDTSSSPDNNVAYNLSNNQISSAVLATEFLSSLKSSSFAQKSFDFSGNNITVLDKAYFNVYATDLNLSGNQIAAFPTDTFNDLMLAGNDISLDLSHNLLTALPTNVIANAAGLTTLYFNDNQITAIGTGAFASLTDLAILDLSNNSLTSLSAGHLLNLRATDISIAGNQLASLPVNLLSLHNDPTAITNFDVSGNNLVNDTWEITTAVWKEDAAGNFTLQLGHTVPANISLVLSSDSGSLNPATITIPSGSTTSQEFQWTPTNAGDPVNFNADVTQINVSTLSGYITISPYAFNGVCDRTVPFPTLLINATGQTDCAVVTLADLGGITAAQDWSSQSINTVTATDLDGLFNVTEINFANNNITELVDGTLAEVQALTLNFSNNNISMIQPDALAYAGSLAANLNWNFSQNAITSDTFASHFLTGKTAATNPSTAIFNFSDNQITTLQATYFNGVILDSLNLSNNQISDFPANTFNQIYNDAANSAIDVDLSFNNITALAANSFTSAAWATLRFSDNQINALATGAFSDAAGLKILDLSQNLIADFNASAVDLGQSGILDEFYLSNNPLTLKPNNFAGLSVRTLYLQGLSTNTVPSLAFAGIGFLNNIYLSNGNISVLQTDAFTNASGLDRVYLNNNSIVTVPGNAFGPGAHLDELYLNDNQITTLEDSFAAQLDSLDILDLSSNSLTSLQSGAFDGLTATDINLADNALATLPIDLLSLHNDPTTITNFNISGNGLTNDSWDIASVTWQQNNIDSITLRLGHALAQDVSFNVTATNGNLNATEILIPAGSTNSSAISWTTIDANLVVNIVPSLNQINITALSGYITIPSYESNGVCDRSAGISTALESILSKTCNLVTAPDLAGITGTVNLANLTIEQLTEVDLVGLINVDEFDLSDNDLTVLADNILLTTNISAISLASNNISVIAANALVTSTSPDNNVDYNLSNNAITSTTLSSGFLNSLRSATFPNKSIDLSYNNITTLQRSDLNFIADVINLSHNQIGNFPSEVFHDTRLADLFAKMDLSYNLITSLPAETLAGETYQSADFSYNQIDTLATNAIRFGERLTWLDLSYNQIVDFNASSIHQDAQKYGIKLDLILDANPLILKGSNFNGLVLANLSLRNSNLTTIPADTFAGSDSATNIDRIFLTSTNLTALETGSFSSAPGLDYLYLNNNQITTIAVDAFGTISSLTRIYLGDNNLTAVPENAFSNLTNLQTLSLDSNQLIEVPVNILGNNASLTTFRMQDNNIANLSGISFSEYTALNQLDLARNEITTLTADNFKGMTATQIYLSGNQISSLPLNLLLEHNNTANITVFDVSGNGLTNDSWEITNVSWQETAYNTYRLQLGHALPDDVTVDINSMNGDLSVSTLTITAGDTNSQAVEWTPSDATLPIHISVAVPQQNITTLAGHINIPTLEFMGVCDRQVAVQQLILNTLNVADCATVSFNQLASITTAFDLMGMSIEAISSNDLAYIIGLSELDLSNNSITELVNGTLRTTKAVTASFANNNIASIQSGALLTLDSPDVAVDYDFSNNAITSSTFDTNFMDGIVNANTTLGNKFDFSNNQITAVSKSFFPASSSELNLSNNQIPSLSADLFDAFTFEPAVMIDLSANQISTIDAFTFHGEIWQNLNLSNNNLVTLASSTFNFVDNLATLDLSDNDIVSFDSSAITQGDATINLNLILNGNPLVLANDTFTGLSLATLSLQDSSITSLPQGFVAGLDALHTLKLNNNSIAALPTGAFDAVAGLQNLDLSNNDLVNIAADAFGTGANFTQLYLQNNVITSFADAAFSNLVNLASLDLSNNALTTISQLAWQGLTATDIDISNNLISALPVNLLSLHTDPSSITNFNIANTSLVNDTWEVVEANWVQDGNSFTLQLDHAVPHDVTVAFSSTTGIINITSVTIPSGSKISNLVSWTPYIKGLELHIAPVQTSVELPIFSGYVNIDPQGSVVTADICNRSTIIQTILLEVLGVSNCAVVTLPDLATITDSDIDLTKRAISQLAATDLDYLSAIANLDLSDNALVGLVNGTLSQTLPDAVNFSNNSISVIERLALFTAENGANDMSVNLSNNAITQTTLSSGFLTASDNQSFVGGSFDLSHNLIGELQQSYFDFAPASLDLSSNQISTVDANTFDAVLSMVSLDLSNNSITTLLSDTFPANQTTLQQLNLSNNQISDLQDSSFAQLPSLQLLDLSNNNIATYPATAFANGSSTNLSMILDNNALQLTANNFAGNSIAYLSLRNMGLTSLPADTFTGTVGLRSIRLDNNSISTLASDVFTTASSVQELYLNQNKISTIGAGAFNQLGNLSGLNLSNNALATLTANHLANLTATDIDLSNNILTSLPVNLLAQHSDPSTISSFNIDGNQLTDNAWEITNVSWVEEAGDSYYLEIGHILPVDVVMPLLSSNGNLNVTQVTITKGATTSSKVSWTASDTLITEAHISPTLATYQVPQLSGYLTMADIGTPAGICLRTMQIIDLLLDVVPQSNCADVSPSDLNALTGNLAWQDQNISTITSSDLVYLANIDSFDLANNNLSTLVDYMFSSTAPTTVSLANNNISVIGSEALFTSVPGDDDVNFNLSSNAMTTATLATGFLTASGNKKFVGGSFDLSDNQITTLEAASLADFNPAQLYLNDNALTSIEDNALAAATDLQTLNLANNQLATVTDSTFSGLSGLTTLDVSNNALANMSDNALLDLSSLVTLNLTNNQLSNITAATFNGLAATAIDLSNNNIASLPIDLLINHTNPANITVFDLAGNGITTWEITTAGWSKLPGDNTQLVIAHALPMDITIPVTSTTGTISPTTVTIAAGSTSSQTVTWTGDAGNALEVIPAQTQVNIPVLNGFVRIEGIAEAPSFVEAVDNQTVVQDHTFTPIQLPIATGGDGALSYSLTETNGTNLPASLVFDPSTRVLSGSVDTAGNYSLTYIAADIDNDQTNIVFTLEVSPNLVPTFPSQANLTFTVLQDEPLNVSLPESSAVNGDVIYTLVGNDALQVDLVFNATDRTISGSTSVTGTYNFTYIATDSLDDESASLNISIVINEQISPEFDTDELFDNKTMRSDDTEFQLALPAAFGGNGELSYSFTTDGTAGLPAGLVFNATSRMIEGQPTEFGTFNITVTLDDSDLTDVNDSASFSFTLILLESLAFVANVEPSYSTVAFAPVSIQLPAAQGGVLSYTYALDGDLPAGLSFNANSRIIMGEALVSGNYNLTYRVTDNDGYVVEQQTVLIVQVLTPAFLSSINDIEIQLGQSINMTLPAVTTDGQVDITYSISGAPAGISFNAATRQLTGGATELGTHTLTYTAIDTAQQQVEQSFDITVTTNTAVLQDIMWRQALAIADQTVNSVKKRFALVNQHRLPYVENANGIGANFQVTETNWLGLWLNSGSGSLANKDSSYSWDGSTGVTQIGVDFSGKDYLVGLTSESVSTSSSFTVTGDAFDYTGNLDVSGLALLSFYGGYYQPKYSVWAITSSGSGSADLSITAEGESSTLSSGVDYSMFAFGGSYKIDDIFDVGIEGITSASLDFSDNTISSVSSNTASRNKFFGSIDFGKWTNKSAKPAAKKTRTRTSQSSSVMSKLSWSPKLALALRSDSGEGSSSSGLEITASVQVEYSMLNFEFGTRNFSSGDFSESGQWLSFNLIPTGKTGLNFTHRQQFGNSASAENALLSDAALTDIVSGMRQDDTVTSISTIAYGWNIKAGSLQLYSKGESSYSDSTASNLFQTKSDIRWEHIGLSFDSASSKYSWNADITGGFMDQYINANNSTSGLVAEDPTTISFNAKIRF